jgi:hypothetical protein
LLVGTVIASVIGKSICESHGRGYASKAEVLANLDPKCTWIQESFGPQLQFEGQDRTDQVTNSSHLLRHFIKPCVVMWLGMAAHTLQNLLLHYHSNSVCITRTYNSLVFDYEGVSLSVAFVIMFVTPRGVATQMTGDRV